MGGRLGTALVALLIAVALWMQVRGEGVGEASIEARLQIVGLDARLVVVNDPPGRVRVVVRGLRSRLARLDPASVSVALDVADVRAPGVIERALDPAAIQLPAGLRAVRVRPERVQLQIDRLAARRLPVRARLDLPSAWRAEDVRVEPAEVEVVGPEVWLETLAAVETTPARPALREGPFRIEAALIAPAGGAIRLAQPERRAIIRGVLRLTERPADEEGRR